MTNLDRKMLLRWLHENESAHLEELWQWSDQVRKEHVGNCIHWQGVIEISNHCSRQCTYCELRNPNNQNVRYRMTIEETMECVHQAAALGYETVVLQAGEDAHLTTDLVSQIIQQIKSETSLNITLCLGERTLDELRTWKAAGADRYLMRFETSNHMIYTRIHPPIPRQSSNRLTVLYLIKELGYEIGSGVMVGIPGTNYDDLANDLIMFRELSLDMIDVGPYIRQPYTPLGQSLVALPEGTGQQVPNTALMTEKMIALARLMCPNSKISSLKIPNVSGEESDLQSRVSHGASEVFPNLTPLSCRQQYDVYHQGDGAGETAQNCHACREGRLVSIGQPLTK